MKTMVMVIINEIQKETEKAILIEGANTVWLPKSIIKIYKHKKMGFLNVYIPFFIAKEKGLLGLNDKGQKMYQIYREPQETVDFNEFELAG